MTYRNALSRLLTAAVCSLLAAAAAYSADEASQAKTVIKDAAQKQKLLGKHMLSLQWLVFAKGQYGQATVQEKNGVLYLKGEQRAKGKDNGYVIIDGRITEVGARSFKFNGKIRTSVSHINNGEECVREGDMNFLAKGNRKYWRLQEMDSPCSEVTDYIDVYFR
jgi:hypothetical protein